MIKIGELVKDFELINHLGEKKSLQFLDKKLVIFSIQSNTQDVLLKHVILMIIIKFF